MLCSFLHVYIHKIHKLINKNKFFLGRNAQNECKRRTKHCLPLYSLLRNRPDRNLNMEKPSVFQSVCSTVLFPVTRFLNMPKAPGSTAIFTTHKSQTVTWNRRFSLPSKQAFKDIAYWWKRNGVGASLHQESVRKSAVWVLLFCLFLNSYLFVYFYYF